MDTIDLVAKKIFDLFIVNPYAIALQQPDGKYITKYVPYDETTIAEMYRMSGSAGCYQQCQNSGRIRWLCLDFDCKDKQAPDINGLFDFLKKRLVPILEKNEIYYLFEFSGRRGIHVWFIFQNAFPKSVGFKIVNQIEKLLGDIDEKYSLDKFPASPFAEGNKVGKQVKIPLSVHKGGGQSFFFTKEINIDESKGDNFYQRQLEILNQVKINWIENVTERLGVSLVDEEQSLRFKKQVIIGGTALSPENVISSLSKVQVFYEIFSRLREGNSLSQDWYVLLGTIGSIDPSGELLKAIFSLSPRYDGKTTDEKIAKWKNHYFPATFAYLYSAYGIIMEPGINPHETGLSILKKDYDLEINVEISEWQDEKPIYLSLKDTIHKEVNYVIENDENVIITEWNHLRDVSDYECKKIAEICEDVIKGDYKDIYPEEAFNFKRVESAEKTRNMIVLSTRDRILTSYLGIRLAYEFPNKIKNSYSYNVAFLSKDELFYQWYTSWGNYIDKIKTFLEVPFWGEWGIICLDVKSFYDSIDYLVVYDLLKDELSIEGNNIFNFLIHYNELLMRKQNDSRLGVPQGPAYARIISEFFLGKVLEKRERFNISQSDYFMLRYVDDIVIFYRKGVDGKLLYQNFKCLLENNGLQLNEEKSKVYGVIKELTEKNKADILRKDKFNYSFQLSGKNGLTPLKERLNSFEKEFASSFRIDDMSYIFSRRIERKFSFNYLKKYYREIFSLDYGRGSVFRSFYTFLFSDSQSFYDMLNEEDSFNRIPINSLNFKNFASTLYRKVQEKRINKFLLKRLSTEYLEHLDFCTIELEERKIIEVIIEWERKHG